MLVSYRWLARHLDLSGLMADQVAQDLTLSTCETEGVRRFVPELFDVTVGFVVESVAHPGSDHLHVCKVDVGGSEQLQIVCGAPNVAAGQKVAVATIGTALPGDLKIKKTKIRGVESSGMICSERELGLGDEHTGIWVLPAEAQLGAPVARALDFEDWVIEIDNKSITHRPDLWGHRGLARELAAIYRRSLKPLDTSLPPSGAGAPFPVRIESPACPRYLALPIDGVRAARSPDWLRWLLLAVGQRPIDLLVDVSNFVMLDLGQPNHLFDRTRLSSAGIVVRAARGGERMQTLDGVERALAPSDLLICDGEAPVALAGVMGGQGSKVAEGTTQLLLEVASFLPAGVRRTSQRLGLRTDASARFEKSLAPTLALDAAGHLVRTLAAIQPALRLPAPLSDAGSWKDPARTIRFRPARARKLLGAEIPDQAMREVLERLGLAVEIQGERFDVRIPSERATKDLSVEQDLIEEIGRIGRYGSLPEHALIGPLVPPPHDARRLLVRRLEDRLAGAARFRQTISYSFVSDALLGELGESSTPHVTVVNPVAEGLARVRRSVVTSLIGLLPSNRRQASEFRLFEVGKGYLPEEPNATSEPREVHELALAWVLPPPEKDARFDASAVARLCGVLDDLAQSLGLSEPSWAALDGERAPTWAHPAKCLAWTSGEREVALLAELEPALARRLGLVGELASQIALARISIDALLAHEPRRELYRRLPRFPTLDVDLAFAVSADLPQARVAELIASSGKGLVERVELFDVYVGPNLATGKKSLAYHVRLRSDERTLGEEDTQKFLARVEREVAEKLQGELRRA